LAGNTEPLSQYRGLRGPARPQRHWRANAEPETLFVDSLGSRGFDAAKSGEAESAIRLKTTIDRGLAISSRTQGSA